MFLTSENFTPPPPLTEDVINDRSLTILLKSVSGKTLAKEIEYNLFSFCPTLLFAIFLFVCLLL